MQNKEIISLEPLKIWFKEFKEDYPWRQDKTPYRVWVSEIMLQQTLKSVVTPYFKRWMEKFPTLEALAQSEEQDVLLLWEGLGYYSRARNLRLGAKKVMEEYGGIIPDSLDKLLTIPGVGPYTAGAILAFAFGKRALALDANAKRVVARLFLLDKRISSHNQELTRLLLSLLPHKEPDVAMEGIIELGQNICTKRPKCEICPLKKGCKALENDMTEVIPRIEPREKTIVLKRDVAIIIHQDEVLVRKNEPGKIMAGLWEFPYVENEETLSSMQKTLESVWHLKLESLGRLGSVVSHFTKYRADHTVYLFQAQKKCLEQESIKWIPLRDLSLYPFSSAHKKIKRELARISSITMLKA